MSFSGVPPPEFFVEKFSLWNSLKASIHSKVLLGISSFKRLPLNGAGCPNSEFRVWIEAKLVQKLFFHDILQEFLERWLLCSPLSIKLEFLCFSSVFLTSLREVLCPDHVYKEFLLLYRTLLRCLTMSIADLISPCNMRLRIARFSWNASLVFPVLKYRQIIKVEKLAKSYQSSLNKSFVEQQIVLFFSIYLPVVFAGCVRRCVSKTRQNFLAKCVPFKSYISMAIIISPWQMILSSSSAGELTSSLNG